MSATLTGKSPSPEWYCGVRHEISPESTNTADVVVVPNAHKRSDESRNPWPRTVTVVHPVVDPAAGVARSRTGAFDNTKSVQEPSVSAPLFDTPTWIVDGNVAALDIDDDNIASTTSAVVQATASEDISCACAASTVAVSLLVKPVDESFAPGAKRKMHDSNSDGKNPLPVTTISDTEPGGTLPGRTPEGGKKDGMRHTLVGPQ